MFPSKLFLRKLISSFPNIIKDKLYRDLRFVGIYEVSCFGKKIKLYSSGFTTIENEIFWNGIDNSWEKISLRIWQYLAKNSSTILDIGANSGIYSIVASCINPKANIHAFEPVERTSKLLLQNISLNMPNNIFFHQKAVSNKTGIATFYDVPTESQYSASLNEEMLNQIENRISYEVDVIDLDNFEPLKSIEIDLIKLDVEMHEPEAIEGMIEIIKRDQPFLLIEILSNEIANKIQSIFSSFEYSYYNIDEVNIPKKVENLTASAHYNYLFVPNSKKFDFDFLR
jgi:FkbM family methyltransferase